MGYYPAFLDVTGRRCLVVGSGPAARDKARVLREAEAVVIARDGFEVADVEGCFLVVDASGDDATNAAVAGAGRAAGALVNVLDRATLCDFIAPAVVRRGPLQVAVSTSGRSPFMAAHLRRELEGFIDEATGALVEMVGELRDRLRGAGVPPAEQEQIYAAIPASGALERLRAGDADGARQALERCSQGFPGTQRGNSTP